MVIVYDQNGEVISECELTYALTLIDGHDYTYTEKY